MTAALMQWLILPRRKFLSRATKTGAFTFSLVYFSILSKILFFLDNGSKLQSMSISDEEITSICPGANGTIFVAAGEIVYQVGKIHHQTFVKHFL